MKRRKKSKTKKIRKKRKTDIFNHNFNAASPKEGRDGLTQEQKERRLSILV